MNPSNQQNHKCSFAVLTVLLRCGFSKKQVGFENPLFRRVKSNERFSRDEVMLELNYSFALFPWLSIVPNVQYIVHPDVLGRPTGIEHPSANALVLGVRVMVNMGGPGGP